MIGWWFDQQTEAACDQYDLLDTNGASHNDTISHLIDLMTLVYGINKISHKRKCMNYLLLRTMIEWNNEPEKQVDVFALFFSVSCKDIGFENIANGTIIGFDMRVSHIFYCDDACKFYTIWGHTNCNPWNNVVLYQGKQRVNKVGYVLVKAVANQGLNAAHCEPSFCQIM